MRCAHRLVAALALSTVGGPATANGVAVTAYVGQISSVPAWHDLFTDPLHAEFVDAYLVAAAVSKETHRYLDERLALEFEGNVTYNFGDQSHWEFNVAAMPRWHRFPWSRHVATSAAFGLGLSFATEVPPVEVQLEGSTKRLLIYWMLELTVGPVDSKWRLALRLHHRSGAFGFLADDGGMNAPSLGVRYEF
jgi:hypothetical protein